MTWLTKMHVHINETWRYNQTARINTSISRVQETAWFIDCSDLSIFEQYIQSGFPVVRGINHCSAVNDSSHRFAICSLIGLQRVVSRPDLLSLIRCVPLVFFFLGPLANTKSPCGQQR